MSDPNDSLLSAFDGHDVDRVAAALKAGADARSPMRGKKPIDWLLQEYTRSDRLPQCLRLLIENGAEFHDPALESTLLDDGDTVRTAARSNEGLLTHRTTLGSAFTPLVDVTLLHIAAEYGNQNAARALIESGADVNARAGVDEFGLNGHTPIFHTVNSNANRSAPIMEMLIEAGAACDIRLDGICWGSGYPWETVFFDVTPISYAQIGLMPQVHRSESDIYSNIEMMMNASKRIMPPLNNVPNRYLKPKSRG